MLTMILRPARFGMGMFLVCLTCIAFSSQLSAQQTIYTFSTPEQEAIYQELIKELRCLVCQNQNLADSNAGLAQDLRKKTYEMVSQGKDRDEVADYMVERYGEFVLYRPSLSGANLVLWLSPFVLLAILILLAIFFVRRSRKSRSGGEATYSEADVKEAKSLIQEKL